jgi:hypothetical protein
MMTVGVGRIADGGERCDKRKVVVSCAETRPGKHKGKGQEMACNFHVALSDHGGRFGQATSRICTDKMCATQGSSSWTTNSGMEATHNRQGILSSSLSRGNEEERG